MGICGGSGSGKSELSRIAANHGMLHLDTDSIYRSLTESLTPCLKELSEEFGTEILTESYALDRKKLAGIVFSDSLKRMRLNSIAHKHILDKTRELIKKAKQNGYRAVLVDAPLLFESEFDKECDYTIAVLADKKIRLQRIIERDGIDSETAKKRIAAQISDKRLIELADFTIKNNGTVLELENSFINIIRKIEKKEGE